MDAKTETKKNKYVGTSCDDRIMQLLAVVVHDRYSDNYKITLVPDK